MRFAALVVACAVLAGCSTMKLMQKKGFSEETLLQLEKEDWGQATGVWKWSDRAESMGVPVDARPIAIRDLKCRRSGGLFDCNYLIDYGRNAQVEGTYKKQDVTVGQDNEGKWSINWIIIT